MSLFSSGGALCLNRLGKVSTTTILPPQDLHIPGLMPILWSAISCHGLPLGLQSGALHFNADLIVASDFLLEAEERMP